MFKLPAPIAESYCSRRGGCNTRPKRKAEKMVGHPPVEALNSETFAKGCGEQMAALLCLVWPKPGRTVATRVEKMLGEIDVADGLMRPRSFVVREEGEVIACGQLLPRVVGTTQGERGHCRARSRLLASFAPRSRSSARAIVRAAFEVIDRGEFEWSLFQTSPQVRPFYEKLGAVEIDNQFVNSIGEDPDANPFWDAVVMRYPSRGGWPEGTIDLRGPGY